MGRPVGTGVQRNIPAEHRRRSIAWVVMRKDRAAGPHFAQRLQPGAGFARKDLVGAADGQREPIALREHDAGRPYLDVDLVDLARRELLLLVMRVIRSVGQSKLLVE